MTVFPTVNGTDFISSLEGIKVGDVFYVIERYGRKRNIVKCEKVTPKQAFVGGEKYRISDGKGLGVSNYHYVSALRLCDEKAMEEIRQEHKKRELCQKFRTSNFDVFPLEKLEQIEKIMEEK